MSSVRLLVLLWFFLSSLDVSRSSVVRLCLNATTGEFRVADSCGSAQPVATANYSDQILTTGWSFLEVSTSADFDSATQAYAAGVAEGLATRGRIYQHWVNTVAGYCDGAGQYCARLFSFLSGNLLWMQKQIGAHKTDPYWQQMKLNLYQLAGLEDGYFGTVLTPHMNVSHSKLLLLQIAGDLEDLEQILGKPEGLRRRLMGSGSCSAFIKPIASGKDLLFSHVTWSTYQSMLRVQKLYSLPYKQSDGKNGSTTVAGAKMSFSSYPGVLWSIDDFYVISSGLAVMETTIANYNSTLWKEVKMKGSVLTWLRVLTANRIAQTAVGWAKIFKLFNSGTYNNQWMVVDYKKLQSATTPSSGLLVVAEQMPGKIKSDDMTTLLFKQGYWASYNVPFFPEIFNLSGSWSQVTRYGDWFTYDKTPRANIFRRDWKGVTDMDSLQKLMRYNNFRKDPLSACNCTPPFSAENAISSRNDLNSPNGSYPFASLSHRSHGGIDMKATNVELAKKLMFRGISGPTYDDQPPFVWSTSDYNNLSHLGQPDNFTFAPVTHQWIGV